MSLKKRRYRKYGENPLSYFFEHFEEYEGMSRSEFERFDPGLSAALRKHDQLDEAIPENLNEEFRGYPNSLEYFLDHEELHDLGRGGLFGLDESLYRSMLRDGTLGIAISEVDEDKSEAGRKGGMTVPLTQSQLKEIVDSYDSYDHNPSEAAKHLDYTAARIRNVWKSVGLESIGRGNWQRSIFSK
ncbi:MAG: hypothetical protein CMH64_02545 [Nanoarchaeota archaeon]|nr:hypothetical protein [Nanoarchaeota archaeon]|tara:strand:+ start:1366 stop:1923 length:558 start_codon:yes stop_codon:yes gene_type:complete